MAEATAPAAAQQDAGYKETIESILVAFILAFIFRAFVVEAFVIPTGSMATTLYGAHIRLTCPDCGYTFDVGVQTPRSAGSDDVDIPTAVKRDSMVTCPNCSFLFPQNTAANPISDPVRYGDRILVLKYLYLFQDPRRWDVVVFKSPAEDPDKHLPSDPEYSQNYIKRLIGNPGESVVILDGDIYVGPANAGEDRSKFVIQRKPEWVQERLWRIVYDNDFIPVGKARSQVDEIPWRQPWQSAGGSGWNTGTDASPSRIFNFDSVDAGTLLFNPDIKRRGDGDDTVFRNRLSDWLAYDQIGHYGENNVSDLKLSCYYTRHSGDGALRLFLTKGDNCFIAELTPGKASLYRATVAIPLNETVATRFNPQNLELVASANTADLNAEKPAKIDFVNCDYQVSLRVNGTDVIAPFKYDPPVSELWTRFLAGQHEPCAQVRLSAEKQKCTIQHLSLWRDIYYGNRIPDRSRQAFWGSPENVVHLGPGEYFVLGDNSQISGDARYWTDRIQLPHEGMPDVESGRVPQQFMLGKAFFVYWPAGYPIRSIPINIVPDFGEMRFIR